jgi:hypothetical protein
MLAAAAVLASGLLLLALSWFELGSVDLGYHIVYGRRFLDTGRIVDRDPYIYAARDHFFVNANWAWQVLVAWLERWSGLAGLILLRGVSILAALGAIVWLARRRGVAWAAVAPMLVLIGLGSYERYDLRPELASYALCMLQLCVTILPPRRAVVACVTTFVLQVIWVNSHSYFIVAPLATAGLIAGDGLVVWRERGGPNRADASRRMRVRAAMLVAQIAACFVNPWGAAGAFFPLRTLHLLREQGVLPGAEAGEGVGPWADISEFKPPFSFIGEPGGARTIHAYLVVLAVAGLGFLAAVRTRRWGEALVIALLAAMSFSMRRNIALFALAATPLAVAAICHWSAVSPRRAGARRLAAVLGCVLSLAAAGWWIPRICTGRFYFDDNSVRLFGRGYSVLVFPRDACAFLRSQTSLQPRLFADFFSSSNVLPYLPAGWQVFIDTNTFAYPPEPMRVMGGVSVGSTPHDEFFNVQDVNVVLLHAGAHTKNLLLSMAQDEEWALVHLDFAFAVFARRIPAHAAVIASHHPSPQDLNVEEWVAQARRMGLPTGYALGLLAGLPLSLNWNEPAARLLRRAVEMEPGFAQSWQNLGTALGQLAIEAGRRDGPTEEVRRLLMQAKACFERTLALEPGNVVARRNLNLTMQGLDSMR